MEETETINLQKITKWLEITKQQHEILHCIYRLEEKKEEANPKNILGEYLKEYKKSIQANNLFPILKALIEREIVTKKEKAKYSLNLEGIKKQITKNQRELQKELEEQKYVSEHVDQYFDAISKRETHPIVKYYGYREGFEKIAELLKTSKRYYIVSTFPYITWTPNLAYGKGVEEYTNVIWDRCIKEKKLEVTYITSFEIDLLYQRSMKIHGERKLAYTECEVIINKIESLLHENENLEIKYLENPMGFFVAIPEKEKPLDIFIFLRDATREVIGNIYIRAEDIANQAKQQFINESKKSVSLRTPKGKKILEKIRKELKRKYATD